VVAAAGSKQAERLWIVMRIHEASVRNEPTPPINHTETTWLCHRLAALLCAGIDNRAAENTRPARRFRGPQIPGRKTKLHVAMVWIVQSYSPGCAHLMHAWA